VRRSFGLPVGLSRVADLPRAPTDREWEQLIGEFRSTFGVQGQVTNSGGLRERIVVGLFGGMAVAAFGANLSRLPRWARRCERQMEAIAERAVELLSSG
jgi:hypothetical protein